MLVFLFSDSLFLSILFLSPIITAEYLYLIFASPTT